MTPYSDITFAIVVWNDAERLKPLLQHVRPYFERLAVVVQESSDDSLDVALEHADIVMKDRHHGFGDASFGPLLLPQIQSTWTFKVDADEWPTEELLEYLGEYVKMADEKGTKGVWIPFRSWVDGNEWDEQHAHLRLFHTSAGWPGMLHSRPPINDGFVGEVGHILHKRSLDEMMRDYLEYYRIGMNNPGWVDHNRAMMKGACEGAASRKGWAYVRSFDWWPEVRKAAFGGKDPELMNIYCTGAARTGTRMVFDIVNKLGEDAVHAVQPGYGPGPGGGLDLANPIWTSKAEWEEKKGPGLWIVITREIDYAAKSAIAAGKADNEGDYAKMRRRVDKMLGNIDGALYLTYEDVVAEPQAAYDQIAEFIGVPSVPASGIFDGNEKYRVEEESEPEVEAPEPEPEAEERVEEAHPTVPDAISADVTVASEDEEKEA